MIAAGMLVRLKAGGQPMRVVEVRAGCAWAEDPNDWRQPMQFCEAWLSESSVEVVE